MKKALAILIFLSILIIFALPQILLAQACPAQPCPPGIICIQNPLCAESFEQLVSSIINFLFSIAVVLAPVMVVVAGLLFVTAGGDPAKVQQAKNILLWTVIGFTLVMLSKGLIAVLKSILGG